MNLIMSTFRHIILVKYHRNVTGAQKQALLDGLAKMPQIMDYIRRYEYGPDLALRDDTYDFALIADFDSENDWNRYSSNPDHQILVHNLIRPIAEEMARVQYLVD